MQWRCRKHVPCYAKFISKSICAVYTCLSWKLSHFTHLLYYHFRLYFPIYSFSNLFSLFSSLLHDQNSEFISILYSNHVFLYTYRITTFKFESTQNNQLFFKCKMFQKNSNFLYKKFTFFECDFFCSIYERKYFIFMACISRILMW